MTNLKYFIKATLFLSLLVVTPLLLFSCNENKITDDVFQTEQIILKDTIYETKLYYFKSNAIGPKVAILGGIHGDEVAGWQAALTLLERKNFIGEVLIIPRTHMLATNLKERFPGSSNNGKYEDVVYTDLNRVFPGKASGTITEQIAYAIIQKLIDFIPDYIIDLHESRRSYNDTKPLIGDEVIYGNKKSSILALDIVETYNEKYTKEDDVPFIVDNNAPVGSLNNYCGNNFDAYVFTFETNRQLELSKRIKQQLDLLDTFFNLIWN